MIPDLKYIDLCTDARLQCIIHMRLSYASKPDFCWVGGFACAGAPKADEGGGKNELPVGTGGGGSENEFVPGRCWPIGIAGIDCPRLAKGAFDDGVAHGLGVVALQLVELGRFWKFWFVWDGGGGGKDEIL